MKRKTLTLAAVLGGLALAAPQVQAHDRALRWGLDLGFRCGAFGAAMAEGFLNHRPRFVHAPVYVAPVHVHHRVAVYRQVWVPACFQQVVVGYTLRGLPILRRVCVSPGHYESRVVGYRCDGCHCSL